MNSPWSRNLIAEATAAAVRGSGSYKPFGLKTVDGLRVLEGFRQQHKEGPVLQLGLDMLSQQMPVSLGVLLRHAAGLPGFFFVLARSEASSVVT